MYRIVDDSIEILLVRPWAERDAWGIPKGHINEGEDPQVCAKREVLEEAGVDIELGQAARRRTRWFHGCFAHRIRFYCRGSGAGRVFHS